MGLVDESMVAMYHRQMGFVVKSTSTLEESPEEQRKIIARVEEAVCGRQRPGSRVLHYLPDPTFDELPTSQEENPENAPAE